MTEKPADDQQAILDDLQAVQFRRISAMLPGQGQPADAAAVEALEEELIGIRQRAEAAQVPPAMLEIAGVTAMRMAVFSKGKSAVARPQLTAEEMKLYRPYLLAYEFFKRTDENDPAYDRALSHLKMEAKKLRDAGYGDEKMLDVVQVYRTMRDSTKGSTRV